MTMRSETEIRGLGTGAEDWQPGARKARTRAAIADAARRLFGRRPVDAVSIDDIVAEAGVAKGSFYNHFADRESLAAEVAKRIRAELDASVEAINCDIPDPACRMVRALSTYWRYALDEPEGAAALARIHGPEASPDAAQNALVVADIADGIARGRFRIPTLEAGLMLAVGMGMVGMLRIVREPSPVLAVSIAQQLGQVVLRGLGLGEEEAAQLSAQAADAVVRGGFRHPPAGLTGQRKLCGSTSTVTRTDEGTATAASHART
jgi:AcrR family transcriptional regulator